VGQHELPYLICTVSLLQGFEEASHWQDWEIGIHGLIIEFRDPGSGSKLTATYLPEIAQHEGWSKQQTIDSLIRKAGYAGYATPELRKGLSVTRYKSTTCTLSYEEYSSLKMMQAAAPVHLD
jgi:AMMECR1 domain-containing protein